MEEVFYVLAIILNMLPFSIMRYYPFRRVLRIPLHQLAALYTMILCAEIGCYLYHFHRFGGAAFFEQDSLLHVIFLCLYVVLSFAMIRESIYKQLYLWFTLALYELAVFGIGIWTEDMLRVFLGLPRFLLLDSTVLLLLVCTWPLCRNLMQRLQPFLQLKRPEMWRWSWVPGAAFFCMNMLYAICSAHSLSSLVICRVLSLVSALFCLLLLLWTFVSRHQQNILRQRFQMTQAMYEGQEQSAREEREKADRAAENYQHLQKILSALEVCAQKEDLDGAHQLIAQEQKHLLHFLPERHFCQHELLDVILSQLEANAKQAGVRTEIQVTLPARLCLEDMDLCVLFGNLLENAMQACKALPANRRWLTLHIDRAGSMLAVTLDNSCRPGSVRRLETAEDRQTFYSAKRGYEEPGIGISSICDIAAKYHGEAEFAYRDGAFYASVLLVDVCEREEKEYEDCCDG